MDNRVNIIKMIVDKQERNASTVSTVIYKHITQTIRVKKLISL